jgi:hypothetical protein
MSALYAKGDQVVTISSMVHDQGFVAAPFDVVGLQRRWSEHRNLNISTYLADEEEYMMLFVGQRDDSFAIRSSFLDLLHPKAKRSAQSLSIAILDHFRQQRCQWPADNTYVRCLLEEKEYIDDTLRGGFETVRLRQLLGDVGDEPVVIESAEVPRPVDDW